jgi:hypothetical protein
LRTVRRAFVSASSDRLVCFIGMLSSCRAAACRAAVSRSASRKFGRSYQSASATAAVD